MYSASGASFAPHSVPSAPLAQLVEQRTFNPQVLGSSPRGRTTGVAGLPAKGLFNFVELVTKSSKHEEYIFALLRRNSIHFTHEIISL